MDQNDVFDVAGCEAKEAPYRPLPLTTAGMVRNKIYITYPEILEMQVGAIIEAAIDCKKEGY